MHFIQFDTSFVHILLLFLNSVCHISMPFIIYTFIHINFVYWVFQQSTLHKVKETVYAFNHYIIKCMFKTNFSPCPPTFTYITGLSPVQ